MVFLKASGLIAAAVQPEALLSGPEAHASSLQDALLGFTGTVCLTNVLAARPGCLSIFRCGTCRIVDSLMFETIVSQDWQVAS